MDSMSRMPTGAPNIFARRSATIDVNQQVLVPDCTLLNPLISPSPDDIQICDAFRAIMV